MSTAILEPRVEPSRNYLNADYSWKSWLFALDHKRIALLYLLSVSVFFLIGGLFAALMRIQLLDPRGTLVDPETYNRFVTLHGVVTIFFFLIPSIPGVLGNFLIPLMVGARNVAFPKLNLLSWYIYIAGGLLTLYAAIAPEGVDPAWTFYTPYSNSYLNVSVTPLSIGMLITGVSSFLLALNFVVTIQKMRAPGLTWSRMPLFVWATYATSIFIVLGAPVLLAVTVFLLAFEHLFHARFFSPGLSSGSMLFQQLLRLYSHPAIYLIILPAIGVVSDIVACFTRKRIFGYKVVVLSTMAIAFLGFLIWGHNMFAAGQSVYVGLLLSLLSFMVAIPSAIIIFNWISTLYEGSISLEAPMLYAIGFIGLFIIGSLAGLFLASLATGVQLNGTYFVVAQFHYLLVGGGVMGYLAGIHFWWPKISGKKYSNGLAALAAAIIFIGFNLAFLPQFLLGYLGMPRRDAFYPAKFQTLNTMSSAGAAILGLGYLIPGLYLMWSIVFGPAAEPNPWDDTGLEWQTSSPPPTENFAQIPVVADEAYAYSKKDALEP